MREKGGFREVPQWRIRTERFVRINVEGEANSALLRDSDCRLLVDDGPPRDIDEGSVAREEAQEVLGDDARCRGESTPPSRTAPRRWQKARRAIRTALRQCSGRDLSGTFFEKAETWTRNGFRRVTSFCAEAPKPVNANPSLEQGLGSKGIRGPAALVAHLAAKIMAAPQRGQRKEECGFGQAVADGIPPVCHRHAPLDQFPRHRPLDASTDMADIIQIVQSQRDEGG